MNHRSSVTVVAQGPLAAIFWSALLAAAVVFVGTVYQPWASGYRVKMAAQIACQEMIRNKKYQLPADPKIEDTFLHAAAAESVRLGPDQFSFTLDDDRQAKRVVCHVKVAWRSSTEWFLVSNILTELKPWTQVHRLDFDHAVADNY